MYSATGFGCNVLAVIDCGSQIFKFIYLIYILNIYSFSLVELQVVSMYFVLSQLVTINTIFIVLFQVYERDLQQHFHVFYHHIIITIS